MSTASLARLIPATERPQTYALDRQTTEIAIIVIIVIIIIIIIIIIAFPFGTNAK